MRRLLLLLLFWPLWAQAEVLVLVHGYLGNDRSWQDAGITQSLTQQGYRWMGTYSYGSEGALFRGEQPSEGGKPMYTVSLPSLSAVREQAQWLAEYLRLVDLRHPGASVTLVGHSAGGVVSRAAVVMHELPQVTTVMSIASPHLGTEVSTLAVAMTEENSVLGWLKGWAIRQGDPTQTYALLAESRAILADLMPETPHTFLFWLNRQPHPDIRYISVVRNTLGLGEGDEVITMGSQDMRNVVSIGPQAVSYQSVMPHLLQPQDGVTIARLLAEPST